jgi:hypothetical protein
MKMTPELKAFRHYRKNIDYYLEKMKHWWGNDKMREQMLQEISDEYGANNKKLMAIMQISYERSVERAFK